MEPTPFDPLSDPFSFQSRCQLLFLPPYSPDLNPIEKFWAWLKKKIQETISSFNTLEMFELVVAANSCNQPARNEASLNNEPLHLIL